MKIFKFNDYNLNCLMSFIIGFFVCSIIFGIFTFIMINNDYKQFKERIIKVNKGKYENNKFIYFDKKIKFIIEGD